MLSKSYRTRQSFQVNLHHPLQSMWTLTAVFVSGFSCSEKTDFIEWLCPTPPKSKTLCSQLSKQPSSYRCRSIIFLFFSKRCSCRCMCNNLISLPPLWVLRIFLTALKFHPLLSVAYLRLSCSCIHCLFHFSCFVFLLHISFLLGSHFFSTVFFSCLCLLLIFTLPVLKGI